MKVLIFFWKIAVSLIQFGSTIYKLSTIFVLIWIRRLVWSLQVGKFRTKEDRADAELRQLLGSDISDVESIHGTLPWRRQRKDGEFFVVTYFSCYSFVLLVPSTPSFLNFAIPAWISSFFASHDRLRSFLFFLSLQSFFPLCLRYLIT